MDLLPLIRIQQFISDGYRFWKRHLYSLRWCRPEKNINCERMTWIVHWNENTVVGQEPTEVNKNELMNNLKTQMKRLESLDEPIFTIYCSSETPSQKSRLHEFCEELLSKFLQMPFTFSCSWGLLKCRILHIFFAKWVDLAI